MLREEADEKPHPEGEGMGSEHLGPIGHCYRKLTAMDRYLHQIAQALG